MVNSKSKILQMLSHSTLNNQALTEAFAPSLSFQQSKRTLLDPNAEATSLPAETTKKKRKSRRAQSEKDSWALLEPKVDHRKIVLEMDLVDKSRLETETGINKTDLAAMKNRDPNALDVSDEIEMVRRKLVLAELGIALPTKSSGEVDVQKLFEIQISNKKENETEDERIYSPLKSEKPTASVIRMIKPMFPLKTAINYREDLTIDDEKAFHKEVEELLYKTEALTDFADMQKAKMQLELKQGIFRERLVKVNHLIDHRFKAASITYLDESVLLKNFKEQLKNEQQVQGKPLFPMKESMFTARWKTLKGIQNHDGIPISHSGHL